MKRFLFLLAVFCLAALSAGGEGLEEGLQKTLDGLDLSAVEHVSGREDLSDVLLRLARGETVWDAGQVLERGLELFLGEAKTSFARLMGLLGPALCCGAAGILCQGNRRMAQIAGNACFLVVAAVMAADMKTYLVEAEGTVKRMAELMETLFPLLLTLLASVGAASSAALLKPAVAAASGTMTALVRLISLPLAMGVAVVTILDHLSPRMHLSRLAKLLRAAATWTLGIAFTVFIGVNALQGMTASAADGISLRAAKYAVDNFVPVVGGMFADTMDTLVGCAMLIKNALGVTGLALMLSLAGAPLLRTLCAVMAYRISAALLQPVAQDRFSDALQAFSDVLLLLFIIQLSVGAMFFLLSAQILAVGNATVSLR